MRVVEVGRHGDDRFGDFLAEVVFCHLLEVAEHHGADFLRGVFATVGTDLDQVFWPADHAVGDHLLFVGHFLVSPSHEAFDAKDGVLWVGDLLVACRLTDEALAFVGEGNDRRCRPRSLLIDQHLGLLALHDCDHTVGGPEVDSDYFVTSHNLYFLFCWRFLILHRLP